MPRAFLRRHRHAMKILIRVLLIGGVLLGGFLFRDRISGNAGDLQVGDCFDVPALDTDISKVQHHPCTEPHTGEVVYVGDHSAAKGTPFAESLLVEFAGTSCLPAFDAYIGSNSPDGIDIGAFYPVAKDWDGGDREITCYLYKVDGTSMAGSLKAS
jgi:Septum formation